MWEAYQNRIDEFQFRTTRPKIILSPSFSVSHNTPSPPAFAMTHSCARASESLPVPCTRARSSAAPPSAPPQPPSLLPPTRETTPDTLAFDVVFDGNSCGDEEQVTSRPPLFVASGSAGRPPCARAATRVAWTTSASSKASGGVFSGLSCYAAAASRVAVPSSLLALRISALLPPGAAPGAVAALLNAAGVDATVVGSQEATSLRQTRSGGSGRASFSSSLPPQLSPTSTLLRRAAKHSFVLVPLDEHGCSFAPASASSSAAAPPRAVPTPAAPAPACLVVDACFRDAFACHSAGGGYAALVDSLPPVFVGPPCQLAEIAAFMARRVAAAFEEGGKPLPPWRGEGALLARWRLGSGGGNGGGGAGNGSGGLEAAPAPCQQFGWGGGGGGGVAGGGGGGGGGGGASAPGRRRRCAPSSAC